MPEFMFIFIVVGVAGLAIACAIMSSRARRARSDMLAELASRNGWTFLRGPIEGEGGIFSSSVGRCGMEPFQRFKFFEAGSDGEFNNVIGGEVSAPAERGVRVGFEAGDYEWVTGSGKSRQTHRRSYLLFDLTPELGHVPDLAIRPEEWTDRLFDAFGGGDIDFESEEFSRRFHVTSSDRRFAFAVIDPRMMEFLMSSPAQVLDMRAGWGLIVSRDDEWEPRDFLWAAKWVREFVDHWPAYLVKECRERRW